MKFNFTSVYNIENAIRGMRNALESWKLSDSSLKNNNFILGDKDISLAQKLIIAGSSHRKFLRQIMVSVDITAPLFWYKEFDTYKVGTVANSTSTMHKIMSKPFTLDMFEVDDFEEFEKADFEEVLRICNKYRNLYLEDKDNDSVMAKKYWKALIRVLPESWLQTRTITMNYENIRTIVHQRKGHKLTEWKQFIDWAHTLPYAEELIFYDGDEK